MSQSRSHSRALAGPRPPEGEGPEGERTAGDEPPELAALYRRHADDVATWARRLGGPQVDAEDIVHEVFLVVQRRLPEWRAEAKITTWLYEITFRVVHDRRRRWPRPGWWPRRADNDGTPGGESGQVAQLAQLAQLAADQPDALGLLERREATATLHRILDGIGEKYRTVIVLFELEGKSGEEIAALTGTSLSNVWIRLHRGRQKVMKGFLAWEAEGQRR